jgi:hypothetical protein
MAAKTQLSPCALPGRRYSFVGKTPFVVILYSEKQFKFKDVKTFTAKAAPGTFKFKARDTHIVQ